MSSVREVALPIRDTQGNERGRLLIAVLPKAEAGTPAPLLDLRRMPDRDDSLEPVQLLEGIEYVYDFEVEGDPTIEVDRSELFDRETVNGRRGRLRPGQTVGTVP